VKFKIHFEINEYEDFVLLEGETVEEIKEKAKTFAEKRGLDSEKNNMWSEEL